MKKVSEAGMISREVMEKFEAAKRACPMGIRKILFAFKSERKTMPNFTQEEIELLYQYEVLLAGERLGQMATVFNREMEELFWRTMPSTLELIPLSKMQVEWPDRSDWPWSDPPPPSRRSGPVSTRGSLIQSMSVFKAGDGFGEGLPENDSQADEVGHDDVTTVGSRPELSWN